MMPAVVTDADSVPREGDETPVGWSSGSGSLVLGRNEEKRSAPPLFICRCTSRMKFQTSKHPSGSWKLRA